MTLLPHTHGNILPQKSRVRTALAVRASVAPRVSPLRDIPTEIGLEIIESALLSTSPLSTSPTALALVSKSFNALVCKTIYKTVVLDSVSRIALFHRTVGLKSSQFLGTHVLALAVTSKYYNTQARNQLEQIVAACTGLRTLALPRPGVLASGIISGTRPIELVIHQFDAMTPFEWDPPFADKVVESPAAHLSQNLTRLRICEPGAAWTSPLAAVEFFGPLPGLTHLALARHVKSGSSLNDDVFVREICTLLKTRANLKMLVVSLFPASWPRPGLARGCLCGHGCVCKALLRVAESDKRLVVLATGWDTLYHSYAPPDVSPPHVNHGGARLGDIGFWAHWKMSEMPVVAFTTGWEPEILPGAVKWTYPTVAHEWFGGHNFWENWLTLPD